jgi:hypothetical protein
MGGGSPIGGYAGGDRGEGADFDPRFGLGQKLEVAGSRCCCCAAGSVAASIGRVWCDRCNQNHGCRARNCKRRHSTEKLLVAVGGHRIGAIVDDATRSGSDIKRTDHRVGLQRNIPVREQHRSTGSGQSISIVVRIGRKSLFGHRSCGQRHRRANSSVSLVKINYFLSPVTVQ